MSEQISKQPSRLKELIAKGKEQGYLTFAEVNDHLPDELSDSDQIEDIIGTSTTWASRCTRVPPMPMT